ncbi:MAG: bifunctional diaminohydroxyphosphoribosylaminopyrimidine deaminase/5-amino-6-(5-phosphoribosylamino)uracil reductase RibD [Nitrospirae bacterium]|nr:bifunctional diaminohydroxyphosphoribosylaminopyrimidine deaminase/5-amino-6-(5-phosphoribosylamino)uracil reductase RibD [Nitrospirota bacterium]
MTDTDYMRRTLRLAKRAAGRTSPNPMVGAVIVKTGRIIAEDFHRAPGTPHAEALVLAEAGPRARGAVLYVNLEPCCHTNKRTPPCTKAIIASGVKKVVIATEDLNPQVSGRGVTELRNAGIEVVTGVLEADARRLNEAYFKFITRGIPFVTLKVAMTLDGKIAMPSGESKWITGERARMLVHRMRSSVDAVVTAIGTVLADDPELTARVRGGRNPMRVVIDPRLEIPSEARILNAASETVIVTGVRRAKRLDELSGKGVKLLLYDKTLNLQWLMERLGRMDVTSVMIEGGSSLAYHALEDGVVDKVAFFIAPKIIGGRDSYPAVGGRACASLAEAYRLRDIRVRRAGGDILVEGYVDR